MSLTLHTARITHYHGFNDYSEFDYPTLQSQIAAYCRDGWNELMHCEGEPLPIPEDATELIDAYFDGNDREFIEKSQIALTLPQPYASAPEMLEALRCYVSELHKQIIVLGWESIEQYQSYNRTDEAYSVVLRAISKATASPLPVPQPQQPDPLPTFTAFCQQSTGGGTIHISSFEAPDLATAMIYAKTQCLDDWGDAYNEENVHLLGVVAGDTNILHWEDLGE